MVSTPVFFAVILVVLAVIHYLYKKNSKFWKAIDEIPGPPEYPFIGHLLVVLNSPEDMFTAARKRAVDYYPIYKIKLPTMTTVNLINPEDIELVVSNMKHITKYMPYKFLIPWLGTGLLTSTGKKWQTRRKILTPAFHFSILQEFLNVFNEEAKVLAKKLEEFCDDDSVDLIPSITRFTLMSIGETAMGHTLSMSEKEKEDYKDAIYQLGDLVTQRVFQPWLHSDWIYFKTSNGKISRSLIDFLHGVSRGVIENRKEQVRTVSYSDRKRLAMLDLLLKYQANGADIDDEGIREEVDTFMFEGHDTTSMALVFLLMLLANHRDIQVFSTFATTTTDTHTVKLSGVSLRLVSHNILVYMMEVNYLLSHYGGLLLREHKEELIQLRYTIELFRNQDTTQSSHGLHYTTCCWSHDDAKDGPDICICTHIELAKKRVQKIVRLYARILRQ